MHILVTGHLGFIGTETIKALSKYNQCEGFDVMDGSGSDIRDITNFRMAVKSLHPHRILHLAAIARFADADRDPLLAWQTNVIGTQNVVDVAKEFHIPLVYASTGSAIMPLDAYEPPYKEDIPARGNSVYGVTKALGEYIVRQHTPHIILRYAHVYGKEKRGHGLVGGFVDRIKRGLEPMLYGGRQTNDFTYVKDIAQANVLALTASWDKWNQTYHIGTGVELTANEAGRLVCDVLGYDGKITVKEGRQVDPGRFCFDISKARSMLGYEPQYRFEAGLRDMFNG
jgi:UDP-glucose 4-epimerase